MLRSPLRELVGVEVPVIQAGMSIFTSPGLVAAVSDAGGLGSLGAWMRPVEQLHRDIEAIRDTTERPFAVNHVVPDLDVAGFELTLSLAPAVVSFALDDAGSLIDQVHEAGSLAMQQVTTVRQAEVAAEHGADIIVAQGGEAGGYGGSVSTLALLPQVVDAVRPVPVVAAGGIADGRGLAAALVLGAAGVNLGTRFLASQEAPIDDAWKQAILGSSSEAWVQLDAVDDVDAPDPGAQGYGTRMRALHAAADGSVMVGGQSAGLIHEVMPAADIILVIALDAERILAEMAS